MQTSLILAFLCVSASSFAQRSGQEPYMIKSLSGAGIKEAFVNTSGGSISVTGGAETRVEVFVNDNHGQPLSKEEAAKRIAENYTLTVDAHDGEVHATAKSKSNFRWNNNNSLSISFRLYVPVRTTTHLETSGGSISLNNLTGAQEFGTSGGSLNIDRLTGNIKGQTSGGSIHVANSKETIDLQTSGGSISAQNCSGNIKLETSGGSLTLNNLSGMIQANTSGGSIKGDDIKGELVTSTSGGSISLNDLSASLNASTSAGSLHANFKQVGKYVKLDVSAGHIDLTLPAKQGLNLDLTGEHVTGEGLPGFSGERDHDRIRGKVNGGGATVRADAGSGRISVAFAS